MVYSNIENHLTNLLVHCDICNRMVLNSSVCECRRCENCHRIDFFGSDENHEVVVDDIPTAAIRFRLKFCRLKKSNDVQSFVLCKQCGNYVTSGSRKTLYEDVWPVLYWDFIAKNPTLNWKSATTLMRKWWIDYETITNAPCTLDDPPSYFEDVTFKRNALVASINKKVFVDLADAIDNVATGVLSIWMFRVLSSSWESRNRCHS